MPVSGTREWSRHSVNCYVGCPHNCRYCYARTMAVRFGRCEESQWKYPRLRPEEVAKPRRKLEGSVMFPTTHDITPETLAPCITVLEKLLAAGNDVLLVSKPHVECIEAIRDVAANFKDRILFRFTIGAASDRFLSYWEPGAPSFEERLACLRYAYEWGFQTSVSAEPCLDFAHADQLMQSVMPYVTDSIWFGKMNNPWSRVNPLTEKEKQAVAWIVQAQSDQVVKGLWERCQDNPMVKWKESIKKVVGIPLGDEPGLDI